MATSGTNYTVKWELADGVLTISPVSGNSGIARENSNYNIYPCIGHFVDLTDEEIESVYSIVFSGDITLQVKAFGGRYTKTDRYSFLFYYERTYGSDKKFQNLFTVDVSGLNTTGSTNFSQMFSETPITNIVGLSTLDVSSGTDFSDMFSETRLSVLDVSNFPLNDAKDITHMFLAMNYCTEITLPNDFRRTNTNDNFDPPTCYYLGLAREEIFYLKGISATKDGITISSDEDFFKLDSAQGGTWTRDISGTASLSFRVLSTSREANIGTIKYTYATTSATADIYLKKASESSFPSTASETLTLIGSGSGSADITLPTDDAYDMKIIVSDGTTSIYLYPSVSSNVLLLDISESGDLTAAGALRAKTEQLAPTISVTTGTTVRYRIIRFGNVVTVYLTVRNTNSVAVGGFIYQATLTGIPLPPDLVTTATYYGARGLVATLSSGGVVYVKNTSSTAFAMKSNELLSLSFTYIIN